MPSARAGSTSTCYPFYQQGLAEGTLTREQAEELLQCFWIKFNNQPAPPKVGVTAAESGTYTDFAQINIGGLREDGSDGVNEVTYLLLDVIEEMRLLQPSASIQVSKKNPDRFIKRAGEDHPHRLRAAVGLQRRPDRAGAGAPGQSRGGCALRRLERLRGGGRLRQGELQPDRLLQHAQGAGDHPAQRRRPAHRAADRPADRRPGGIPLASTSCSRPSRRSCGISSTSRCAATTSSSGCTPRYMPAPFLSLLIDDCIATRQGLPRRRRALQHQLHPGRRPRHDDRCAVGASSYHVFDQQTVGMAELLAALDADFAGHERLRQLLLNRTPRYGNDDDYADDLMRAVFEAYFNAVDGRPNTKGGDYHINLLPTTCHVYFGSVTGATPDGRRAGEPALGGRLAGAGRRPPRADRGGRVGGQDGSRPHRRHAAQPEVHAAAAARTTTGWTSWCSWCAPTSSWTGTTSSSTWWMPRRCAPPRSNPEQYRDLIVRVAGYSDYFCDLSEALQDEIIARTEHQTF